jgi:hypothetical protein
MNLPPVGVSRIHTLISVQGAYPIRITDAGVLTCDDVIKVPLGYVAKRQTVIDKGSYNIIPVVELVIPIELLVFEIITNEGATVEPFSTLKLSDEANPYNGVRYYFVLPPRTTGIKDVIFKPKHPSMRVALQFEVLPPPYNYDNALFGVITSVVSALDGRVDALESKTNNLRIVSHELKDPFPYKDLPKGSGKQTLNIDKDMLFIGTNFTYSSVLSTVHSPKITVSDGITTKVYTLSLDRSVRVIIDLLTATLTAYDTRTGEIVQQRKIFETVVGYKSIDYEDFDDILGDELTVLIGGRTVE